eukprot:CAMPEP_0204513102 /NCGR_PEP_ID=MMETSP0661-20131031/1317_1 /ASSEMBLY_ACC=CAM_ASM_000606 /TAXON_ID=109239 /ORGANISM="Alexandrium margalefi, Strain AMGDE01CS-322" /LENGTH=52 /DNA_ID=CAMNT_0051518251 /DNA_START=357 /DNA_END=511 /DNA_ORIENTATION=-
MQACCLPGGGGAWSVERVSGLTPILPPLGADAALRFRAQIPSEVRLIGSCLV